MAEEQAIAAVAARLAPDRPRLGFRPTAERGARTVESARRAHRENEAFRALSQQVLDRPDTRDDAATLAGKWIVTGNDAAAELAVQALGRARIRPTGPNDYSAVWRYALAYDWLYNHPAMSEQVRDYIESEIGRVLELELADLDGGTPAMWHGRNQYANNTVVAALSLSRHPKRGEYLRRALHHYVTAVRALAMVEGWPEGPSYWICNRAVQYPLAADCVRTALGVEEIAGTNILEAIRTTGHWQLHQMMPNRQFVPIGDAFGGSALGTWHPWTECIDYYATYTRDPVLIAYAEWARQVSMKTAYRRFGWALGLIYDPFLPTPADYDRTKPAEYIARHVPTARLFGRRTTGLAFFRSSWTDPAATFVSFKAGDLFAHHGHYDQGQFTIFKHAYLAPITGEYRGYFSPHRVGYYIQTVGVNSLLVLAPGEYSNYLRNRKYFDALSGGQRVVMATGADIQSPEVWQADQHEGRHYEAGDIVAYQSAPGDYDYIAADITAAYNSTRFAEPGNVAKVSQVSRHLVFLHQADAVVVFDRVVSTKPEYRKRWLLHHKAKPEGGEERVIQGSPENGIVETAARRLVTAVGEGKLIHEVLLPAAARVYKIGGEDFAFYVQADGNGAKWNGRNLGFEDGRKPLPAAGLWRTEVEPAKLAEADVFLNVLWPRAVEAPDPPPAQVLKSDEAAVALRVGDQVLVFPRLADRRVEWFALINIPPGAKRILLFGAMPNVPYLVQARGRPGPGGAMPECSPEGVIAWAVPERFAGDVAVNMAKE